MKKRFFSLFVCTALLLSIVFPAHTAWADTSSVDGGIYTDPDTGLTFVVPDGWNEQELDAEASNFFQVQFVSQQGAGSTLLYGSIDLWNAATASERSGLTRSDFNSNYIYTLDDGAVVEYWAERFVQGAAEVQSNAGVNDIQLVTYGKNEFIEYSVTQEVSGIHFPLTVVFFIENGYMHIFMFSAFGGTSVQATQDFHAVLSSLPASPAEGSDPPDSGSRLAGGNTYTDPDTGTTFVVPEGWEEDEFNREGAASTFQVKFISLNDLGSSLLYGNYDLWNEMTASERSGLTRSEIDSAHLYADKTVLKAFADLASQEGLQTSDDAIQLVTYGRNECIELSAVKNIFGINVPITMTWYVENGYAYIFTVLATGDQVGKDFQSVMYSLQVPETDTQSEQGISSPTLSELLANDGLHPLTFLLNLLLTFSVYTLPILIYRFALRSGPLEKKRARKIAIIYGICAYLLRCIITALFNGHAGIAIVFWSYVNYRILISGKKPEPDPADIFAEHPGRLPPATQPPAPQAPSASSAAPSIPAASAPASAVPKAPSLPDPYVPAPAAYIPASAPHTPPAAPAAPNGASAPAAPAEPAASMWPAQYHSAQDMRAGFPKKGEKAPAATPVPDAPFIPVASAPQTPSSPAAYIPAPAAPQAPPSQAVYRTAPSAPQTPPSPAAYAPVSPAAHTPASPAQQTAPHAPRVQFCRNCGFRLLEDSKFCSCCGTPVVPITKE